MGQEAQHTQVAMSVAAPRGSEETSGAHDRDPARVLQTGVLQHVAARFPGAEVTMFNPSDDSPETREQMLTIILMRELRACTSEKDLRSRLAKALSGRSISVELAEKRVALYIFNYLCHGANYKSPETVACLRATAASMAKDALSA